MHDDVRAGAPKTELLVGRLNGRDGCFRVRKRADTGKNDAQLSFPVGCVTVVVSIAWRSAPVKF